MEAFDHTNIERSEEVQEILTKIPSWVMRYGIGAFFFTFLILLLTSAFLKYPDVLAAPAIVTTKNPPVPLKAKTSGKIQKLFINEGEMVHVKTDIAVLENPAKYIDVKKLEYQLKQIDHNLTNDSLLNLLSFTEYDLGDIQSTFTIFIKAQNEYTSFQSIQYHKSQIGSYTDQKKRFGNYVDQVSKQEMALSAELELMRKRFSTDSLLQSSGAKTKFEMNESKRMLLQKLSAYHGVNSALVQSQIQMSELDKNIADVDMDFRKQYSTFTTDLKNSYESLNKEIKTWYQNYVLTSPIPGVVSYSDFWTENLTVESGQEVFIVSPKVAGEIYATLHLPVQGSAKVKVGQRVNIRLTNYPAEEYGLLVGSVAGMSSIPNEGNYLVKVTLENGLITTYKMKLEFLQQMAGNAEIITKDRSILSRIFAKLKLAVSEH